MINQPYKIFACKLKNKNLRMESQSGGAFSAIALSVLRKSGVVYGCGMDTDNKAVYKRIDKINDLIELKCELCKKVTLKPFRGTKMSSPHQGFFRF